MKKSNTIEIPNRLPAAPSREELETLVKDLPEPKLVIKTQGQYDTAMQEYKAVGEVAKSIKAKKDSVLDPLKLAVKNFNAIFRPFEDKITAVETIYKAGLNQFIAIQQDKRRAELEKIENDKRLKNPATIQSKLSAVTASVDNSYTVRVVKILDLNKIPLEYFILDEAKIKAADKAGIIVPGVEVVEEKRARR